MAALIAALIVFVAGAMRQFAVRRVRGPKRFLALPGLLVAEQLETASRRLRTGASLRSALRDTRLPIGRVLADGYPVAVAAERWALRVATPSEKLAATAVAVAARAGGPQALALESAARAIRERLAAHAEVLAHSAQARLSGLVIAALPAVFLSWSLLADRRTAALLLTTPLGWLCLFVGLGLDALGLFWIRRIVGSAT